MLNEAMPPVLAFLDTAKLLACFAVFMSGESSLRFWLDEGAKPF
jgi:hypothetical protein